MVRSATTATKTLRASPEWYGPPARRVPKAMPYPTLKLPSNKETGMRARGQFRSHGVPAVSADVGARGDQRRGRPARPRRGARRLATGMALAAALALVAATASADSPGWPQFRFDPTHSGSNPAATDI